MRQGTLFEPSGPFANLSQVYFGSLDTMAKAMEPALKGAAGLQLEMMAFVSQRARAYMELPAELARCKAPSDVVHAQVQFWRTLTEQYAHATRNMTTAATSLFANGSSEGAERDYITFAEPKEQAPSVTRTEKRRAA